MYNFCIVGAGPSGIYAADALSNKFPDSYILVVDSLPNPFGLVRSGVAPDHEKIKEVTRVFDKVLCREKVTFIGGVNIGENISIEELKKNFSAIILCHGTSKDRKLNLENENLENIIPATDFVGWYNSNPEYENFKFPSCINPSDTSAVVIGQGNVAIDITRILLKSSLANHKDLLYGTDISNSSFDILKNYSFKDIYLVGRRGPLQFAGTDKELKELCKLEGISVEINPNDLKLSEEESIWLEKSPKGVQKNYEILKEASENKAINETTLHIKFFLSPTNFLESDNRLKSVLFSKNKLIGDLNSRSTISSDEVEKIDIDYTFISVGYKGDGIRGVNFDTKKYIYPNFKGRIIEEENLYTSGWIKRGPSGVIGTNKADSVETVNTIEEDIKSGLIKEVENNTEIFIKYLKTKYNALSYSDWKKLDAEELRQGIELNKSRNKFSTINKMKEFLSYNT